MEKPPKFIADEMNGDVARWLRIIGFDCLYIQGKELDNKLIEIAATQKRILLTSDKELFKKAVYKGVNAHYISQAPIEEKLRELATKFNLDSYLRYLKYRCPICNNILIETDDLSRVPPKVRQQHKTILYCKKCDKYYWRGSHWKKINEVLENAGLSNVSVKKL